GETHGLIAATADQSNGTWGCSGTSISGATGTAIGTGQANTSAIVAGCGTAGIAARVCNDYTVTVSGVTYSDWYLPSKDELEKLYINRVAIGGFSDNIGYNYYWSSSQYNANDAWDHYFTNGIQYNAVKYATSYVRAVRTF
ncbi:MAG: DUF1566 domain-containing protein, partial [Bacteroidota bacterium]